MCSVQYSAHFLQENKRGYARECTVWKGRREEEERQEKLSPVNARAIPALDLYLQMCAELSDYSILLPITVYALFQNQYLSPSLGLC